MELLGEFFTMYGIDIHQLNIGNFLIFDEIPFKKCVVLHLFSSECIISFFRKKPLPYQRGGDFINGHCIIFSIFFCLVMFHESQT
jgi:hypothetical protein